MFYVKELWHFMLRIMFYVKENDVFMLKVMFTKGLFTK